MAATYSKKWSGATFILSVFILFFYLKDGFSNLNSWVYHLEGDSLKNYYNAILAAKYSDGLWLNNVNYPFGEQLFFLDSQPLLAKILGFLGLGNYTIGFINFLPFLSIALTTIPIFLIQRTIKIPLALNILTSITIALLSPQIGRVSVHFALAYTIYIPTLLYLLIDENKKGVLQYILITFIVLCFSFLHPYYLLIGVVLLASFLPYHLFFQMNKKLFFFNFLAILIPLIIVKLTLILSDPVLDRPESPFGIWQYRSTFESVFAPKYKPFSEILAPLNIKGGTFEGNAYVGVLGFPVLVFTIISFIKKKINHSSILAVFRSEKFFYLFFASSIIWLFALYYPFQFIIDPFLEIIPALKQFRSLGRFGWIFYYTFSIFITLNLANIFLYLKRKTNLPLAFFSVLLACILWFLDANGNMNTVKEALSKKHYTEFKQSNYLSIEEASLLRTNHFDAILTLPVFSVGSEIENYTGSSESTFETYKLAVNYGVPFVSTYSSRVSAAQFYKIKDLKETGNMKGVFLKKEKILIIADTERLNDAETALLNKAEILFQKDSIVYAKY